MNNLVLIFLTTFLFISCNSSDSNNKGFIKNGTTKTTSPYAPKKENIDIKTIISTNTNIASMRINNNLIYTQSFGSNIHIWDMNGIKIGEIKDSNSTHSLGVDDDYIYASTSLENSIKIWDKNSYTLNRVLSTDDNITLMYHVQVDDKYFYSTYCSNSYDSDGSKWISCINSGFIIVNKYTGDTIKNFESNGYGKYSIDNNFLYKADGDGILIFNKNDMSMHDIIHIRDYYDTEEKYWYIDFIKVIDNEIYIHTRNKLIVLNKNNKEIVYSMKQDNIEDILVDDLYVYMLIGNNTINAFNKNKKTINSILAHQGTQVTTETFFINKNSFYFYTKNKVKKINIPKDSF